jgi:predicted N-formylglutamate amidohydrolase
MRENEEISPPVARVINVQGSSSYVLLCEHASRYIPAEYEGLGLPESELRRHIAWDIGAEQVAMRLSRHLDAPLIAANYSRLLIDLNRPVGSATSVPQVSESTVVSGNADLSAVEHRKRIDSYFTPFQNCVGQLLDARKVAGSSTTIIGIHSFTPIYNGVARPWQAGILFRKSARFGRTLALALGGPAGGIAENQPYQIDDESDYTVPVHGEARGLDAVLVEIRQDLISSDQGATDWARRLATALGICVAMT